MRFHLTTAYHHPTSQETLKDIVGPIACALRDLGHHVTGNQFYAPDALNLLVECFPPHEAPLIKEHRYAIIATERYNGYQMRNPPPWRTATFKELAPAAEFIWSLTDCKAYGKVESSIRERETPAKRQVPHARLHIGYSKAWSEGLAKHRAHEVEPDSDLIAFGVATPARFNLVADLRRRGVTVLEAPPACSIIDRDYLTSRARYVLGFPATDDPRLISGSRYAAAIHAGRPILFVKPQTPPRVLDGFGLWAAPVDIPRVVLNVDWRAQLAKQTEWLATHLPMTSVLERCLTEVGLQPKELANAA